MRVFPPAMSGDVTLFTQQRGMDLDYPLNKHVFLDKLCDICASVSQSVKWHHPFLGSTIHCSQNTFIPLHEKSAQPCMAA